MAFINSFARACRMGETNETNLSSVAKFLPFSSKFTRTGRSSASARTDSPAPESCCSHDDSTLSSTDAGEDICTTYVDFDDFASTSSDGEASCENNAPSPRLSDVAVSTCVYSVMMLLRLRAAVCKEEDECDDAAPVHYSTRHVSELPATPKAAKSSFKASPSDAADSWRAGPTVSGESWRQSLPTSASDSWVAQQRERAVSTPDDDAIVVRNARSILNKLTVEKFDSLFEQLATCGIKHPRHISILMREVFEKATTQHHFIPMYADLCVQLERDPRIAALLDETDQLQNFRRLLLNQCQHVFEQLLESQIVEADADKEVVFCRKQQALGNMKLIGQLLVHGMLGSDLFTECCEELLRKRTQCPDALESLVALMMVAGPKFDHRDWQHYRTLEKILSDMGALTKDKSVQPRLRFIICDVLDARGAGWPSIVAGRKMPAKLEEVRTARDSEVLQKEESPKNSKNVASEGHKKKTVSISPKSAETAVAVATVAAPKDAFAVVTFRRELASIFSDLASNKSIPAAVQRVREQHVPIAFQADQFVDILTRTVEERRGAVRRCQLAFIAGLAAAQSSAFDRQECLAGIELFFKHVYAELCNEVHRLPAIMKSEFMPTVCNVFPVEDLNKVVPAAMRK